MKRYYLPFTVLTVLVLSFSLVSCNDDDDDIKRNTDFELPELTADNTITFNFTPSNTRYLELHLMGEKVAVDWGDGSRTEKDIDPAGERQVYTHRFNSGEYTVKIWVGHLTFLKMWGTDYFSNNPSFPVCPELTELHLYHNVDLEHFDGAGFPKLEYLNISETGKLKTVDVSKCSQLKQLDFSNIENLTELDLSENSSLEYVELSATGVSSLNLGENENLTSLYLDYNNITSFDVTNLKKLELLNISHSGLTSLQLDGNSNSMLTGVMVNNNNLSAEALDAIFTALPKPYFLKSKTNLPEPVAVISFNGNPGSETCNPAIATEKGWKIVTR